jgi:hypothetical protein
MRLTESEKASLRSAIMARLQHIRDVARAAKEEFGAELFGLCEVERNTLLAAAKKLGIDV